MKTNLASILKEALKLPPEARAAIAGSLLASLDKTVDADAESAWEAEVERRVRELDSSSAPLVGWAEARRAILGR